MRQLETEDWEPDQARAEAGVVKTYLWAMLALAVGLVALTLLGFALFTNVLAPLLHFLAGLGGM
jgi:hypothetical protein